MWWLWLACAEPTDPAAPIDTGTDTAPGADTPPQPPTSLQRWLVGSSADALGTPTGPVVIAGGGGQDVDSAMRALLEAAGGGDVVVLRTTGEDGYNRYFYDELGVAVDSVETLRVDTRALADDPYVSWRLQTAEAVFVAGGDQRAYLSSWEGTAVQEALRGLWARGAALGGTSAGAALLGERVFSAEEGTVYSDEALEDPTHFRMTYADGFLSLPVLADVVVDTHFYERDRMGRLLAFMACAIADGLGDPFVGVGIDEGTAVVIGAAGQVAVHGSGYAYVVEGVSEVRCHPGAPLETGPWGYHVVHPGDSLKLPSGDSDGPRYTLSVGDGRVSPADPY